MLIKRLSKLLIYLFLVESLLAENESKKHFVFQNNKIGYNNEAFSQNDFQDLSYSEYQELRKELAMFRSLSREYILEDLFPHLTPQMCGEEKCRTSMFELVNQSFSKSKVKSMPAVVIIAGMHGTETLGMRALIEFIKLLQKLHRRRREIYQLFYNIRILVIPVLNMSGFYNGKDFEVQFNSVKKVNEAIDPNYDFNVNPRSMCFQSLSSRFLYEIYKDNLIWGTFLFSKGDFTVTYPQLSQIFGNSVNYSDEIFMNRLLEELQSTFAQFSEKFDEIPSLTKNIDQNKHSSKSLGQGDHGMYVDWAFGASFSGSHVSERCLDPKKKFKRTYRPPTVNSNKAIAIEISLDKTILPKNWSDFMGNEIACVDANHPDAKMGMIPALVNSVRRFLEIMSPMASLNRIEHVSSKEGELQVIDFLVNLKGCVGFQSIKLKNFETMAQEFEIKELKTKASSKLLVALKVTLDPVNRIEVDQTIDKFVFDIDCESGFLKKVKKFDKPKSHFLVSKMTKKYLSKMRVLGLPDMRNFSIYNVRFDMLSTALLDEEIADVGHFVYGAELLVEIGGYFPLKITYNREIAEIEFSIVKENIPHPIDEEDESQKEASQGEFLLSSLNRNEFFREQIALLTENVKNLRLIVSNDNTAFVCSEIHSDSLIRHGEELQFQIDRMKKKENESDETEKNSPLAKKNKSRTLKSLLEEQNMNKCTKYLDQNGQKLFDELRLITLGKPVKRKLIPSVFLSLVGHYVKITFQIENPPTLVKNVNLNTDESTGNYSINGKVVMVDPAITQKGDPSSLGQFPGFDKLQTIAPAYFMKFPFNGMSCLSTFPFWLTDTASLDNSAVFRYKNQNLRNNLYIIRVVRRNPTDITVFVRLFTTSKSMPAEYWLFNKKQKFVLKKKPRSFQIPGQFNGKDMVLYEGRFPIQDLRMLGMYAVLFEPGNSEPVFDCFMNVNTKFFSMFTHYILYKDLETEIEEIQNEKFSFKIMSFRKKVIMYAIPIIFFVILFLGVIGGLIYHFKFAKVKHETLDVQQSLSENIKSKNEIEESK